MYWCRECDHGFVDLVELPGDEPDETYLGCPYCGSSSYRDLVGEADAYAGRMEDR